MKMKRTICLILSIMMMLSVLVGCQIEPDASTDLPIVGDSEQNTTPSQTQQSETQSNENAEEIPDFDTTLESIRVVVDGIVHNFDVQVADDAWYISAQDAQTAFGGAFTDEYVSLDAYAQTADIRYTQDEVLTAAYFSTWEPYAEAASVAGFETYAEELNLPLGKLGQETISGTEMAELLDHFVAHEAPEQIDTWKQVSKNLRNCTTALNRIDGVVSLFVAAWCIGGGYMEYEINTSQQIGEAAFTNDSVFDLSTFNDPLIPSEFDVGDGAMDHYATAAVIFNISNPSPVDSKYPFAYDLATDSFRNDQKATYLEAIVAILRVYSTKGATVVSVDDPAAVELSGIFTEGLLQKATAPSKVTADSHPQWTGMVLLGEKDFTLSDVPAQISECANWGFNSVRLNLSYEQIFDREVTEINLANLRTLDQIVAEAVKYNLHLNIMMLSLPGRWGGSTGEFEDIGEFDLYLNKEKQEQANRIFKILTTRYKGISSDYLSFGPVFEPMNRNLSTGEMLAEYSYADYGAALSGFIDTIQTIDPNRLIIVEITEISQLHTMVEEAKPVYEALKNKENVIYSYNFAEDTFIYANMTAESGRNIDDENRSFYLVNYPTQFYTLDAVISDNQQPGIEDMLPYIGNGSLLIDGCLPADTVVEIHLRQTYGGTLQMIADGEVIYSELLENAEYHVGEAVSGFINYAASEYTVRVTLPGDTELLEIATPGGAVIWSAMDIILPEQFAHEKWYYATPYDVYQGLEEVQGLILKTDSRVMIWPYDLSDSEKKENQLTIHENLSFSTPTVRSEASYEHMLQKTQAMKQIKQNSMIRYENATFHGVIWESAKAYYEDIFKATNACGIGWWSNDWEMLTGGKVDMIAGCPCVEYGRYPQFNLELLKLIQQYQNSERP